MLKLDIDKFAILAGERTSWSFLKRKGFSHWKAHHLAKGLAKSISFDDLLRLCTSMRCTPNDLFEFSPSAQELIPDDHPLRPLMRKHSLANKIESLNYEDLKIAAELKQKKTRK